jgi:hypothetical protein
MSGDDPTAASPPNAPDAWSPPPTLTLSAIQSLARQPRPFLSDVIKLMTVPADDVVETVARRNQAAKFLFESARAAKRAVFICAPPGQPDEKIPPSYFDRPRALAPADNSISLDMDMAAGGDENDSRWIEDFDAEMKHIIPGKLWKPKAKLRPFRVRNLVRIESEWLIALLTAAWEQNANSDAALELQIIEAIRLSPVNLSKRTLFDKSRDWPTRPKRERLYAIIDRVRGPRNRGRHRTATN